MESKWIEIKKNVKKVLQRTEVEAGVEYPLKGKVSVKIRKEDLPGHVRQAEKDLPAGIKAAEKGR